MGLYSFFSYTANKPQNDTRIYLGPYVTLIIYNPLQAYRVPNGGYLGPTSRGMQYSSKGMLVTQYWRMEKRMEHEVTTELILGFIRVVFVSERSLATPIP